MVKMLPASLRAMLGALALLLVASGSAAAREQLVIGMTQFPSTLNPNIDSMMAKAYVLGMAHRPFTAYDADWELVCLLCTKLPTLENGLAKLETLDDGRQGIAVTYSIHSDATWGDGVPVTTEDVMFTYETGAHPQSGIANAEFYRRILRIDVKDDKTFTMHFDRVEFTYNAINDFELLPAHLERDAFAEPAEYRNRTTYDADPANPGLWFGPYRIVSVTPGAQIVLERNPTWWGEPPAFERVVVRVIENTAALEANLLSGAIDYIAGEVGLTVDQALAFETRHGDRFDILYKPVLFYEHLDLNLENPILADRRVRQALLFALDRQKITQQLFGGQQPVAFTSVSPLDWVHTGSVPRYAYDPERAAALLDEAGWTKMRDGIRHNAAGDPLSLELMSTAGDRTRELVEQVLQSQWRAVGVDIRIRNQPARVLFSETLSKRQFEGMVLFAWLSAPENVPRTILHSESIPTPENNFTGQNYTGFRNAKMDRLIDAIEVELDRAKREQLWHRLQVLYAEGLPALPLFFRAQAFILPPWLDGVTPTGHLDPSTLWIEDWRVSSPAE
ncbi:peptide ABC transporter substrate-binding protein [Rhodospirillaceae bacterium SYSU D60014]|uniref:peptide ABC transporter substrate-binding protein n=1 Tax=Virgifigura deserti TaxID=2268457 RepID=UPI000E665483